MNEEKLEALLRDLPSWVPSEDRRAVLRAGVLAHATRQPAAATPVRRTYRRSMVALAAGLLVGLVLHRLWIGAEAQPELGALGTFASVGVATFEHELTRADAARDERIRLRDGQITIWVRKLGARDRFRVILDDAEVEVRGTRFTVEARDGRLAGVVVQEGLVEVRTRSDGVRLLGPGEQYRGPLPSEPGPPSSEVEVANDDACSPKTVEVERIVTVPRACICPAPSPLVHPNEPPKPPEEVAGLSDPTALEVPTSTAAAVRGPAIPFEPPGETASPDLEQAFAESWRHFQEGRFRASTEGFARVRVRSEDRGLASDALYFEVLALRRINELDAAVQVLERALQTPDLEPRADELRLLLASTLFELGRRTQADRWLTEAEASAIPSVRREARLLREATTPAAPVD